ncbi:MAG TPA: ASCH domain-containing protein, partial [Longimicrobium sp.]|nr:ASCH domain-containing protein [Longimicrobium sp.]
QSAEADFAWFERRFQSLKAGTASPMHPSVTQLWRAFLDSGLAPSELPREPVSVFHFCDNEADADHCAALVVARRKQATAASLWWHEACGEPVPRAGDHHVVTDWSGEARCVIRTTEVAVVSFRDVTAEHAAAEGEGDLTLEWWRVTHWAYYHRELAGTAFTPRDDMPIVCERFIVVFPVIETAG